MKPAFILYVLILVAVAILSFERGRALERYKSKPEPRVHYRVVLPEPVRFSI